MQLHKACSARGADMVEQRSKWSKATQRIGGERRRGKKVPIAGMSGAVGRLALSAALLVVRANAARAEEGSIGQQV